MRWGLSLSILWLLAACEVEPRLSAAEPSTTLSSTIVNGTRQPQVVNLTEGETRAIGFLTDAEGDVICTGTLISSRLVITAAHCVTNRVPSEVLFGVTQGPSEPAALLPITQFRLHPTIDFAVLILGLDVDSMEYGIEYLGLNRDLTKESWVGEWVDAAGFGITYTSETGLFFAKVEIIGYQDDEVVVDGHGQQGICYGDSGGPILWQQDEFSSPVIVGTEQWGDASCVDQDHLARMDRVLDFVDAIEAEQMPPLLSQCNGAPAIGQCEQGRRVWCSGGFQYEENCDEQNLACGWRGPSLGYACLPETCGELDYFGRCSGDILEWCGLRGFRVKDCAAFGLECHFESTDVGYNCGSCTQCDGECVDFASSVEHCGGCDKHCALANAHTFCVLGHCQISSCLTGFVDADGIEDNGCEHSTNLTDAADKTRSYGGCASIGEWSPQTAALWFVGFLLVYFAQRRKFS